MDPRFVATSKVIFEQGWKDAGEAHDYTAAELDAIADFAWPWEGLQQAVRVGLHALQRRWDHRGGRRHVVPAPPRAPQLSEG